MFLNITRIIQKSPFYKPQSIKGYTIFNDMRFMQYNRLLQYLQNRR
jgi:hypothetical protein